MGIVCPTAHLGVKRMTMVGGGINDILKVVLTTGRTLPAYRNDSTARNDSCERTLMSANRSNK